MGNFLVIDDEPALLALAIAALRKDGHTVHAVSNPLEAIEICTAKDDFDLVIIDINMEPIGGFEVVYRLRLNSVNSPVLFMTGGWIASAIAERIGHRSIIDKPFTALQFRRAVNNMLLKHGKWPAAFGHPTGTQLADAEASDR